VFCNQTGQTCDMCEREPA